MASRAGAVAARKSEAALVAERVLGENLVTTNWNQSIQSGTISQGQRQFRYTLQNESWSQDSQNAMRQLTATVYFTSKIGSFPWSMSTLVSMARTAMRLTPPTDQPGLRALPRRRAAADRPALAFTLMEVLLAMAICAVVLVAINTVFSSAVRLRDKTTDAVEQALPLAQAMEIITRDLKGRPARAGSSRATSSATRSPWGRAWA